MTRSTASEQSFLLDATTVKILAVAKKLTYTKIARHLRVSLAYFSLMAGGLRTIPSRKLEKLCRLLSVSADRIVVFQKSNVEKKSRNDALGYTLKGGL